MNRLNQAKEISQIDGNIEKILENSEFKKELVMVLLSGLRRMGFRESQQQLEKESGVSLPSGLSEEFKEFVLQGRFDQALGRIHLKGSD